MTKKKKEAPEVEEFTPITAVDGASPSEDINVIPMNSPSSTGELQGGLPPEDTIDRPLENHRILSGPVQESFNASMDIEVSSPKQPTEEMQNVPVQVVTVFRCVKAMDQMGLGTNIVMALKASPDYQSSVRPGSVGNLSISTVSPGFNGWFEEGRLYRVTIQPLE